MFEVELLLGSWYRASATKWLLGYQTSWFWFIRFILDDLSYLVLYILHCSPEQVGNKREKYSKR